MAQTLRHIESIVQATETYAEIIYHYEPARVSTQYMLGKLFVLLLPRARFAKAPVRIEKHEKVFPHFLYQTPAA